MTGGGTACAANTKAWLTTGQVARRIGVTDETVRRLIATDKLEAQRIVGGAWRIPRAALATFMTKGVIRRKPAR